MTTRRKTAESLTLPVREIGIALVGIGAVGLVAVIVAFIVIGAILSRLEAVSEAAAGPLESTARTVSDAAEAFDGFSASLGEAQQSAASAAAIADQASETLDNVADAMSIQIFGTQPLLQAAEGFRQSSAQLASLGDDLEEMGDALGANIGDVEQAATNLREVRNEMNGLLTAFETQDGSDGGIGLARIGIYLLLAWLGVVAVGCAALGALILRR